MTTKLTLSIDDSVVAEAKEYARESGKSLSKLIEGYLRGLCRKQSKTREEDLPPILKRLYGCIKTDDQRNDRDVISDELFKKYGK